METISKIKVKWIRSLNQKKYRDESNTFLIEGLKMFNEAIQMGLHPEFVVVHKNIKINQLENAVFDKKTEVFSASQTEMEQMTALKSPTDLIAVFKKNTALIDYKITSVVLDDIQDPGNLGTILRSCAWFGINQIVCSKGTVDCFNPKVVQASMGAIFHVNLIYCDLESFFLKSILPLFATYMEGTDFKTIDFPESYCLLMGNEGKGIRQENEKFIKQKISIPKIGKGESLNVATALSVILGNVSK